MVRVSCTVIRQHYAPYAIASCRYVDEITGTALRIFRHHFFQPSPINVILPIDGHAACPRVIAKVPRFYPSCVVFYFIFVENGPDQNLIAIYGAGRVFAHRFPFTFAIWEFLTIVDALAPTKTVLLLQLSTTT